MRLTGVVQDYATRQPLAAQFFLKTSTGRTNLGSSTETGRFQIDISCQATMLLIERKGYRPQQLPLNEITTKAGEVSIPVIIPLIAVDPEGTDRPYLQSEQTHTEQQGSGLTSPRPQQNVFVITDAFTNKALPAKACFVFTNSGQKRCFNANAAGQLIMEFDRKDIIAVEIAAPGYQTYKGNINVEELNGRRLQHVIRLTRELVLLSVQIDGGVGSCELRTPGSSKGIALVPVPAHPDVLVAMNVLSQVYTLVVLDRRGNVREQRPISLRRGLNVEKVAKPLVAASTSGASTVTEHTSIPPLTRTDSLPLIYFERSSYAIQLSAKQVLLQIAAYLIQRPELKLRIIGHTDAEGDERLNRALAENRARVVLSFLTIQGIDDHRLEIVGFGSRYPAAPSDTEANKAKNRRVQLKFMSN
ncbi:OmpA family protein [Fibrisoma montanum]|nr:OmpA family protein [Fibrisoma montanum]